MSEAHTEKRQPGPDRLPPFWIRPEDQRGAPDWVAARETDLALTFLVSYLPHRVKHMLHYRVLGFSWKAIGGTLGITANQAKSRFYYGVQKAYETLLENQAKRGNHKE